MGLLVAGGEHSDKWRVEERPKLVIEFRNLQVQGQTLGTNVEFRSTLPCATVGPLCMTVVDISRLEIR